jgi:vancomycin resistance protein YoaR
MSRRVLKPFLLVAFILAGLVVVLGFAANDARNLRERVAHNVSVGRVDVSGQTPAELNLTLDQIEENLRITPVRIATFDGGFQAPGGAFGLRLDRDAIRINALNAQRPNGFSARVVHYFTSLVHRENIPLVATADRAATAATLSEREGSKRRDPVDPQLRVRNGAFAVLPGSDGEGIDVDALVGQFPAAVAAAKGPITLKANRVQLPSTFTNEELQRLVDLATARTANPIRLVSGGSTFQVSSAQLRAWVKPRINDRRLELSLNPEQTIKGLKKILGDLPKPAVDAKVTVDDQGQIISSPSEVGSECCADDSVKRLERALASGGTDPVTIDLKTLEPKTTTEMLASFKITKELSTFTTRHKAGEDRVKNIHRIADIVRGQIIPPGETFSLNGFVGERTAEKGFVEAHVIEDGVFKDSFGGGISQFTTTLFNAAFFGGLDIPEYKAHSIYISRYPFGREATLSWEKPDLKIHNESPYGVLIWPTYTASTITVTLYSSPYATGVPGEPEVTMRGQCKVVKTVRTRTFIDGTTKTDTFHAEYLPKEGVACNGDPTPGATTTTLKPVPTSPRSDTTPAVSNTPDTRAVQSTSPKTVKPAAETPGSSSSPRVQAGGTKTTRTTTSGDAPSGSGADTTKSTKSTRTTKADTPSEPKPVEPKPKPVEPKPAEPTPGGGGGGAVVPVAPPVTGVS